MSETFAPKRFLATAIEGLDEAARVGAADLARRVVEAHDRSGSTLGQFADAIGWSRATLEAIRYGEGERRIGLRLIASLAAADPKIIDADLRHAALAAAYLEILRRCNARGGLDATTYALLRRAEARQ